MTRTPIASALAAGLLATLASLPGHAVEACTDFHGHANATWLANHALPEGVDAITALGELESRVRGQQVALLNSAMQSPENQVQKLLGDFWASGLSEAQVERDGAQPLGPLLERINAIRRARDIPPTIAALHQVGIPVVFNFGADVDLRDLQRHIGYFTQGGLGLPDPAFYTRDDAATAALMERYREYVRQVLVLTGTPERRAAAEADQVIDLERRIAAASRPLSLLRNPEASYALVQVDGLAGSYPHLQLDQFLQAQGVDSTVVSLANPALFAALDGMVDDLKPAQWRAYLRWRVGDAMAPYLSKAWRDIHFDFHGRVLAGRQSPPSREQQVLDAINLAAGPMLGREYASRYVQPATRERAEQIAGQVREALGRALQRDTRLGPEAKAEAAAKLARLSIEIGTPPRDLDYTVQPMGRGSFGGNMLIASTWHHREQMRRIGEANAHRRWNVLPQQASLAYDIAHNRLVVTAAALQSPILDATGSLAAGYGSFGALVGHELSHGFDVHGRMVDAAGELREWWNPAEVQAWRTLAGQVATQYSRHDWPGLDGRKVDGSLTASENVADLAGVQLAWEAMQASASGSEGDARREFFTAWAGLWPQQLSTAEATRRAATSPHAPGKWRTNVPLMNLAAFGEAFGCKASDPMRLPPADQLQVWPQP